MPEVAVVIPAYNAERFIGEAIRSALSQTVSPAEVIVVDDGSTDGTCDTVRSFGSEVVLLRSGNAGSGRARNLGWRRSSAQWVAFLDADDEWVSDKLERQFERARATDTMFSYCGKLLIDEHGVQIAGLTQESFPEGDIFVAMIHANYVSSTSCVLVARETLEKVGGFDERGCFRNSQDYELWLRITAAVPVSAVPQPLVRYRLHGSNVTKNILSRHRGHLAALESALRTDYWKRQGRSDREAVVASAKREACRSYAMELWRLGLLGEARARAAQAVWLGARDAPTLTVLVTSFLPKKAVMTLRDWRRRLATASSGPTQNGSPLS